MLNLRAKIINRKCEITEPPPTICVCVCVSASNCNGSWSAEQKPGAELHFHMLDTQSYLQSWHHPLRLCPCDNGGEEVLVLAETTT